VKVRSARPITAAAVIAVAVSGVAGCGGRRETAAPAAASDAAITCTIESETRIGIATGNTTGVYYQLGNAFATQISDATGGKLKATAAETGASVQNIQQLVNGQYQVAFSIFDTATDAVNGTESFTSKQPVRALARIYNNYTQVVARADAGINSVADMKGKRVSTGSPKSGTEVIAHRLLKAAGVDPESGITAQRLDLGKSVEGMKDGSIDAMVWSGGLPTGGITDLFTSLGDKAKIIDISAELQDMQAINPAYQAGSIPAATYKRSADVPTIVVPNVLLVRDDLDANVACVLTKTLFDKRDDLAKVNAAAKGISLDTARKTDPVPLHRGAEQALKDLGAK